ncbi:phosphoribosylformylglycinamidine synthase [Drosophila ficusphila]|uniref:phosphoribosylformylglycinamidine synthase n=1 Tax=Drosophila ficusphila TaxID=30025 RepID=UPI0007E83B80|nr:phosphoribosylformylglycinamidine synthase [Drosophila ficusphila]XP_017056396.1 phosphoribosylformylglycinamidine synthase [Drosophila ficusphila]XP_017056404.1 phosphoribosylformylglycinamidine synthase [Drosophila ficusphila]XP_017056411.1 phosphoribosylformylglycinamidine synthase [Drosophila ficusphila]
MVIIRCYDAQAHSVAEELKVLRRLQEEDSGVVSVRMERCYHLEYNGQAEHSLSLEELLVWLVKQPLRSGQSLAKQSVLQPESQLQLLLEIGPRFNFSTPYSTNCVNIFHNLGYSEVQRVEVSTRYLLTFKEGSEERKSSTFVPLLGDRMTQCLYTKENIPKDSFDEQLPERQTKWHFIPVLEEGRKALEQINQELGLAFNDFDLDYYHDLFCKELVRNPTTVELFDCAQSNSEHSRHWFFRGRIVIDGVEQPKSLIRMIMDTQAHTNPNNTIKFSDNSSAIVGFEHQVIVPSSVVDPGPVCLKTVQSDLIFTAETHNMPTAVAPFSGATTGTGGRLRDVQGVGRGGVPIAGTAGYCVGALNIPGYKQPYESADFKYPVTFAPPLQVLIEASNGASDYGNKFGEPLISGFALSYGLNSAADASQRDEYVKPIMFSGGLGTMPALMREKLPPARGQLLAKIGGPVYRIGVGGGAASSVEIQGSGDAELDFNAVQRGDAEMENKLNRVVRACLELGEQNPILAIHDQGAGGNGNVLKELVEPGFAGAVIFSKEFNLGDPTITALELWGAEYQENNAILCKAEHRDLLEKICRRERCPISFVGVVTGDGRVTLLEEAAPKDLKQALNEFNRSKPSPFDLELKHVLGDMPKRTFQLSREHTPLKELCLPKDLLVNEALERVLSLVAVGSKRFLTNKVDRCVGGLIAQQQCVGPLQAPLSDYALTTVSHFTNAGIATSIGTQPLKGLLDPAAMARMCVAEALTNLVFVKISELKDVKCSGNWMWAAKLPGEGAKMFDACKELCQILEELHIAIDGGKDSLSMAAKVGGETIKSPGTLVISTYAPCPDVRLRVTPDLKGPGSGLKTVLLWINLENSLRLGGSALAQVYAQQGIEVPSLTRSDLLSKAFAVTQSMLGEGLLRAGHDVSDGGLLVCLVEMAIGGLSGLRLDLSEPLATLKNYDAASAKINRPELALLFAEECGWVVEILETDLERVRSIYGDAGVPNFYLGMTDGFGLDSRVVVKQGVSVLLDQPLRLLYQQWERTSYELEKLQANPECVKAEYDSLEYRRAPQYRGPCNLQSELILKRSNVPVRVAVLREEGVNSEREMMACLLKANFEVHDVTMSDLLQGTTRISEYRGLIFPGGFSYADTLGSAKGWAANILHNPRLLPQFEAFKRRQDVFSLGICNGCQLMTLIGFVGRPGCEVGVEPDVALVHNLSQRFECRWSTVRIPVNRSIMLASMQNLVLGCWVAHGEGRFEFRDAKLLKQLHSDELVTMQYVDDAGEPTELYPLNPNGSPQGVAGVCSTDGRHLALMPHPERCYAMYQWPYVPPSFEVSPTEAESPWQIMFNNAYRWCVTSDQ